MPSTTSRVPLLTPQEAAEYLRVSDRWLYNKIQQKIIPHSRVGKFIRIRKSDLDAYVDAMRVEAIPNDGPKIRTSQSPNPHLAAARVKLAKKCSAAAGGR